MKKYIFKVIVIFSFLLFVTSAAVLAADESVSASYRNLETYDYQYVLQKYSEQGGSDPADVKAGEENGSNETVFTFHEDGWYIARFTVQVWDKQKEEFIWKYSDSRAKGQKATLSIDNNKYEVNRVGSQIWFSDYFIGKNIENGNLFAANKEKADEKDKRNNRESGWISRAA